MVNPISSATAAQKPNAAENHPAAKTPPPPPPPSSQKPDSVHLSEDAKAAADADHDGDSH
jgi:hypothetical protein